MDQNYIIEVRPQDLISERTKFYEKLTENSSGSVIRKIERMQKIKVKPLLHINYLDKTHKNCSLKLPPKSINQEINTFTNFCTNNNSQKMNMRKIDRLSLNQTKSLPFNSLIITSSSSDTSSSGININSTRSNSSNHSRNKNLVLNPNNNHTEKIVFDYKNVKNYETYSPVKYTVSNAINQKSKSSRQKVNDPSVNSNFKFSRSKSNLQQTKCDTNLKNLPKKLPLVSPPCQNNIQMIPSFFRNRTSSTLSKKSKGNEVGRISVKNQDNFFDRFKFVDLEMLPRPEDYRGVFFISFFENLG